MGPPREILLDEVGCNGTEASLLNCPNDGIFNHDCSQFEHAGVICSESLILYLHPLCDAAAFI